MLLIFWYEKQDRFSTSAILVGKMLGANLGMSVQDRTG